MRYITIITVFIFLSCKFNNKEADGTNSTKVVVDTGSEVKRNDSIQLSDSHGSDTVNKNRNIKVLVIQCSNGYEYALHDYDFNPVIEGELNKADNIKVIPFPYKKLMGVAYQGVYDKKYCKPILEKVEADYYIMTAFVGTYPGMYNDSIKWGYETKILNTKTLNQKTSIGKKGFKKYEDIEVDIKKNITVLIKDIQELK